MGGVGWVGWAVWFGAAVVATPECGLFSQGFFFGGGGRDMSIYFEKFETLLTASWVVAMAVGAFSYNCFAWLYGLIT